MEEDKGFPKSLLNASSDERMNYFEKKVIRHPILDSVCEQVLAAIRRRPPGSIINVCGPTGVGKSTLYSRLYTKILEFEAIRMDQDPGYIPAIAIEIPLINGRSFSWLDFYKRLLRALAEPMLDKKIIFKISPEEIQSAIHNPTKGAPDFRLILEDALRERKTRAILGDEGVNLTRVVSASYLLGQMDTVKSLANMGQSRLVLFGSYDLNLSTLSDQLDRRSLNIHFHRYRYDVSQERKQFKNVILSFQKHLPLAGQTDLVSLTEYIYERTLGCVGILKEWLSRSLADVLDDKKEVLTKKILDSNALPLKKITSIAQAISIGEQNIEDNNDLREIHKLMGHSPKAIPSKSAKGQTKKKTTKQKPFRRSPGRDQVGLHEA